MADRIDRRAAVQAYRERRAEVGIYAIRCHASGGCWVGSSRDLAKIRNRHWFSLRLGNHRTSELQAAWTRHGEEGVRFEILETLDADTPEVAVVRILKERCTHWLATCGARPI